MMKKTFYFFIALVFSANLLAQEVYWPANSSEINTGSNATYLVQSVNLGNESILFGYNLGAFYTNDSGELTCGGFVTWAGVQTNIAIYGDDSTTSEKDGFNEGEQIIWLAYDSFLEETYEASVVLGVGPTGMGSELFSINSINIINVFNIDPIIAPQIYGCTDTTASNYNSSATVEDDSCLTDCYIHEFENPISFVSIYSQEIVISNYEEGSILDDVNNIIINVNLEHSYMGDLNISLTSPNGVEVFLHDYSGGGVWLGEASDGDDMVPFPGVGYNYGWSMNPSYDGTMENGALDNISLIGGENSANILNSDTYLPLESFSNFIGSSLNGTWTLSIEDNMGSDNGSVFSWEIILCGDSTYTGCTDPLADNFDSQALYDNESCYRVGCFDELACNYDEFASVSDNFNCVYSDNFGACAICSVANDGSGIVMINDDDNDGVCNIDEVVGCIDLVACNYNEEATDSDNSCIYPGICDSCISENDGTGIVLSNDLDNDGVCDDEEIYGCNNSFALNYDPNSTENDGTCLVEGCTDETAINYNMDANISLNNCGYYLINSGSNCNLNLEEVQPTNSSMTILLQSQFLNELNISSDSATILAYNGDIVVGYIDLSSELTQFSLTVYGDDILTEEVDGALSGSSLSFYLYDGLSTFVIEGVTMTFIPNFTAVLNTPPSNLILLCEIFVGIEGCTNIISTNYNQYANMDDSTCITPGCVFDWADNYDSQFTIDDGSCYRYACMSDWADNYDLTATEDDESCFRMGCIDQFMFNYDELATIDDGSCIPFIYGCMNSLAVNFYPEANTDDNSCVIFGCTDSEALNYLADATNDNGSCGYYYLSTGEDCDLTPAEQPINTGSNMTVMMLPGFVSGLNIQSEVAYIIALDGDIIVGYADMSNGVTQNSISIWGDDTLTPEVDGAAGSASISFQLVDGSSLYDVIPSIAVSYTTGSISAQPYAPLSSTLVCSDTEEIIAVEGCTLDEAENYNAFANVDDFSCIIIGCTLDWADNFNSLATHNDGSCTLLFSEDEYNEMDSILSMSSDAILVVDSVQVLNSQLIELNNSLDSLISLQAIEIESLSLGASQYDIIVQAYGDLEQAYEECLPNLYGQIVIELAEGWNMIGYNLIYPTDPEMQLESFVDDVQIIKNNNGDFYWPTYNFNGMGQLVPGQGYQIRMYHPATLIYME